MCGIAGLIHRGNTSKVGFELQGMLQALKHRGEDSTGYALYGKTDGPSVLPYNAYPVCLLYTSPSPRDMRRSRMPSSA